MSSHQSGIFETFFCCLSLYAMNATADDLMSVSEPQRVIFATNQFAFGAKLGQAVNPVDKAYKEILNGADSLQRFKEIFQKGNSCAKLYALCGIYEKDKKQFRNLSSQMEMNVKVQCRSGCVVYQDTVAGIIARIQKGEFSYLAK